jgi:hypothetical protein
VGTFFSTLCVEFVFGSPTCAEENCPQSGEENVPTQSVGTRGFYPSSAAPGCSPDAGAFRSRMLTISTPTANAIAK